jgi:uncharacterized protein YndB with AHSA1/START domain
MTPEGTLIHVDGQPALRFERRYPQPMERVWRAVSDPAEMGRWFPAEVEGERVVGAELTFVDESQRTAAREADEPTRADGPELRGRVVTYDPPNVFAFTWGPELLRFELLADGDHTRLVFTQILSHQSVGARNASGWHMCLGSLDALLGVEDGSAEGWQDVYSDYLERLGPELGSPRDDGAMTWERATHVDQERVREVAADLESWGAGDHASEPLQWDVEPGPTGTLYRLTHAGIGRDAELAATWHALLIQLDMYLAAEQLVPVEPKPWIEAYERSFA